MSLPIPGTGARTATTDASGTAVFAGVPAGPRSASVHVSPAPGTGYDQRAAGDTVGFTIAAGVTTSVDVTLRIGGTISGRLLGPWTTTPTGLTVAAYGSRTGTSLTAPVDREGRYFLNGLPSDLYVLTVQPGDGAAPTVWRLDVLAQQGTAPASHVIAAAQYVHSTYDLEVVLDGSDPDSPPVFSWSGATVTITSAGTSTSRIADTSSSGRKTIQVVVPSAAYTVEITTPARAATPTAPARPAQHYWYAGPRTPPATSASSATPVPVRYGTTTDVFVPAPSDAAGGA